MDQINDIIMIRLYNGYLKVINSEYSELINHIFQATDRLDQISNANHRIKLEKEEAKEDKRFLRQQIKLLQGQAVFLDEERNKMYNKYKALRIKIQEIGKKNFG